MYLCTVNQREDSFTIKIKQFEGPFDLLLFFIERDEIDILDIPISKITNDFLEYIRALEELNIDIASEFILVAATLMRIKAKMLLPRPELDEDGQEIDPRHELAQKLLEYKRFKDIIGDMESMADDREKIAPRGNSTKELKSIAQNALVDVELESLSIYKLFKTFESVMYKLEVRKHKPKHLVYRYNYTIQEQKVYLIDKIKTFKKASFETLFEDLRDRLHAIITFLSLLEMINAQEVNITTGAEINSFWLELAE
ncbi:MAG: segregation and condensation protein A [Saprospiraceae bacterium]